MLASLRRARLFGYFVLVLASGLSSGVAAYAHTCPTEQGTGGGEHAHDGSSRHCHGAPGDECRCLGSCHLAWSATAPAALDLESIGELPATVLAFTDRSATNVTFPSRLLPPSTAPPSTL
jgi:hypothetical protein